MQPCRSVLARPALMLHAVCVDRRNRETLCASSEKAQSKALMRKLLSDTVHQLMLSGGAETPEAGNAERSRVRRGGGGGRVKEKGKEEEEDVEVVEEFIGNRWLCGMNLNAQNDT